MAMLIVSPALAGRRLLIAFSSQHLTHPSSRAEDAGVRKKKMQYVHLPFSLSVSNRADGIVVFRKIEKIEIFEIPFQNDVQTHRC